MEKEGNKQKQDPVRTDALRQSTIELFEEQLDWLDEMRRNARKGGGKAVRKAAIVRALIDLARHSQVDLAGMKTEEEVVSRLQKVIKIK